LEIFSEFVGDFQRRFWLALSSCELLRSTTRNGTIKSSPNKHPGSQSLPGLFISTPKNQRNIVVRNRFIPVIMMLFLTLRNRLLWDLKEKKGGFLNLDDLEFGYMRLFCKLHIPCWDER
jgi:hypothetical protein